jgi:hypothetical protein
MRNVSLSTGVSSIPVDHHIMTLDQLIRPNMPCAAKTTIENAHFACPRDRPNGRKKCLSSLSNLLGSCNVAAEIDGGVEGLATGRDWRVVPDENTVGSFALDGSDVRRRHISVHWATVRALTRQSLAKTKC